MYTETPSNNFCLYFWKIIFLTIVLLPLAFILCGIITLISVTLGFLFGFHLKKFKNEKIGLLLTLLNNEEYVFDFQSKHPLKVGRLKFYPYQPIVIIAITYFLYFTIGTWIYLGKELLLIIYSNYLYIFGTITFLFIIYVIGLGIYCLVSKTRRSESWKLLSAFVKTKKEKICPIIKFE